jgi:hypothetical protein
LNITNTAGSLLVKDGKLSMQNLAMNLLEGSMALSGEYNTQDTKVPSVNLDADIRQFDVASALSSFSILEKILPNPQNYAGKVSVNMTMDSILDEHLSPVLNTVASKGQLRTHNLKIQNSELFGAMANLLKNESWRTPTLNNVNVKFEIRDGRLSVEPIKLNVAQTALELSGSQGLDMTLNYKVNGTVPVSAIGAGAADLLGKIPGGSRVKEVKLAGLIGGTAKKPAVSLDAADMAGGAAAAVKEVVKEDVDKQVAAVMAEAEKQAQAIRDTTKQTTDKIRGEAEAAAKKLEDAAKSPLEKTAAKIAANKLRDEGKANAAKVEQEAEKQVSAIMDAAKKKADSL